MEDIVRPWHRRAAALQRTYIADVKLNFMSHIRVFGLILVAHIILFLLVARENTDFPNIGTEKTF